MANKDDLVLMEYLGKTRTGIGAVLFESREGYKYPVGEFNREKAERIVSADARMQEEAIEAVKEKNALRREQNKNRSKIDMLEIIPVPDLCNFRIAIPKGKTIK